jgi:hypothetical protein
MNFYTKLACSLSGMSWLDCFDWDSEQGWHLPAFYDRFLMEKKR